MYASSIVVESLRSFAEKQKISLSPNLNIIIGNNNVGKSTLTYVLRNLQQTCLSPLDIHLDAQTAKSEVVIHDIDNRFLAFLPGRSAPTAEITTTFKRNVANQEIHFSFKISANEVNNHNLNNSPFKRDEPDNWIFPYLSNRRTDNYQEDINAQAVRTITGTHQNLTAKLDRLNPREYHAHEQFRKVCSDVLGFIPSTEAYNNGKRPAQLIKGRHYIPMTSMGSGVPQVAGLVSALCEGNGNLFLIEEIENDLHPRALKKLLKFIADISTKNQIILTTHSNIVLNYLGVIPETNIVHVAKATSNGKDVSIAKNYTPDVENRIQILEEMGSELLDSNMWEGWIFFEESSAERIVRDFIIPWFAPSLNNRIRTIAANSISAVRKKIEWFTTIVTFMHLQRTIYQNRVWALVDNGVEGQRVIDELKESFCGDGKKWTEDRFVAFSNENFENYYPQIFKDKVADALSKQGDEKREAKRALLEEVITWLREDPKRGKSALQESASEVIKIIQSIESALG